MRAVRIARSVGRPSRLKKPPGILPAAYIRSSTSIVSGKKSAPSRGSCRPCAAASTIESPLRTTTAPSACFASLPVSNEISWFPTWTETCAKRSVAILMNCPPLCFGESGSSSQLLCGLARTSTLRCVLGGALAPEAELLDQGAVALEIVFLEIGQEAPAARAELQQAAPRVTVLRVRPQVPGEVVDALREHRDL